MDETNSIGVPIEVRSHEVTQLQDTLPFVVETLARAERDEAAQHVRNIYSDHITSANAGTLSLVAEDWRTIIRHLDRIEDRVGVTRVWWLRTKLVDRLEARLDMLGGDE